MYKSFKIFFSLSLSLIFLTSSLCVNASSSINDNLYIDSSSQGVSIIDDDLISDNLPSYYNSFLEGYVTSPKNQYSLNTCWAFAGTSILESYLLKNNLGYFDFSEEHLNIWATTRQNSTGFIRNYFDAGYSKMVSGYLTSFSGGVDEKNYPYGTMSSYSYEQLDKSNVSFGVTELMYVGQDINTVKESVYKYGSVYANCTINSKYFNDDKTAFCADENLSTSSLAGHVVSIVGWDDDYNKDNFNKNHKPKNNGAWLVKNSWGIESNENGFIWISYEDKYLLSDVFGYSYAVREVQQLEQGDKLYQHDEFGSTYNMTLYENINGNAVYDKELTFINVFDFSNEDRILNNVIFESESVGGRYKVYIIPVEDDKPIEDKTKWEMIEEGIIDYSGYHSIEAKGFDLPLEKCGIGVEIDTSKLEKKAGIGISETVYNSSENRITLVPEPEENEGYIIRKGEMYEFLDFYKEELKDENNVGNITIKAYTSIEGGVIGDVDENGRVDISDVVMIQKYLSQKEIGENEFNKENADVNKDEKISIEDAQEIQKKLARIK